MTMAVNPDRMIAQLTLHEGGRRFPYVDTVGKITIGVGRNLTDRGLSDDEIDLLLADDLDEHWTKLTAALPWVESLNEVRQRVLLDMAFNLGVAGLLTFKQTLAAVHRGDWDAAASGMLDSKWARQVGARATRLATMMRTGEDFRYELS